MTRLALVLASVVGGLVVACGAAPLAPGGQNCAFEELPADAMFDYSGGGGIAGATFQVRAFADGKVEAKNNRDRANRVANVGVDRIRRLEADLRATHVMEEEQGCYAPAEPSADSIGASVVFKTSGATFRFSQSELEAPKAVERALQTAANFANEIDPLAK